MIGEGVGKTGSGEAGVVMGLGQDLHSGAWQQVDCVGIWKAELSGFAGALAVCPPGGDHSLLVVFISAHSRSMFHRSFFLYSLCPS